MLQNNPDPDRTADCATTASTTQSIIQIQHGPDNQLHHFSWLGPARFCRCNLTSRPLEQNFSHWAWKRNYFLMLCVAVMAGSTKQGGVILLQSTRCACPPLQCWSLQRLGCWLWGSAEVAQPVVKCKSFLVKGFNILNFKNGSYLEMGTNQTTNWGEDTN